MVEMKKICIKKIFLVGVCLLIAFYMFESTEIYSKYDRNQLDKPKFSQISGFYTEPFYLEIRAEAESQIYYTLDGSIPDEKSILYDEPIWITDATERENVWAVRKDFSINSYLLPEENIKKCNIIRAVAVKDKKRSEIITASFFVGGGEIKHSLPVISLISDPENFFDYEKGIWILGKTYDDWKKTDEAKKKNIDEWEDYEIGANFRNKGQEWEREAVIEYFTADGRRAFTQEVGIRNRGKSSSVGPTKTLNLYAREELDGNSVLNYDIFGNGRLSSALSLRNNSTILKDGFISKKISERGILPQLHYQPVVLYLNGEYWGLYNLTEKQDSEFFSFYYNVPEKAVAIFKNGLVETWNNENDIEDYYDYYDLLEFVSTEDMSLESNYRYFCEQADVKSLIEYYCTQIYIDNIDCTETYNVMVWRSDIYNPFNSYMDKKWRWVLYDINASELDYKRDNVSKEIRSGRMAFGDFPLLSNLLKNEEFRCEFYQNWKSMLGTSFLYSEIKNDFLAEAEYIFDEMTASRERFPDMDYNYESFEAEVTAINEFYQRRKDYATEAVERKLSDYGEFKCVDKEVQRGISEAADKSK